MSDFVCVGNYYSRETAEMVKGMLEAEGIPAFVAADDCGAMEVNISLLMGGVRLMVMLQDADRAAAVLGTANTGEPVAAV